MKSKIILLSLMTVLLSSCGSLPSVNYANREWHISKQYGQIIDKDTTYRMTFGNVLIPENMALISCADSAAQYPGMDKYIAQILETTGLQHDEVLFYSPCHGKIFVRLLHEPQPLRPSSISVNLDDKWPYTMWIYDDYVEDWHRKQGEMYTYTYFDKGKGRILVVDFYDYGNIPVAEIFVIQSRNKMTDKMQLPAQAQIWDFSKHSLKDYMRDVEFWSHQVDGHRENAFANYKIGQKQQNQPK